MCSSDLFPSHDYFTSVLPRAQYGDESAVPIGLNNAEATIITADNLDKAHGFLFDNGSFNSNDNIQKPNTPPTSNVSGNYAANPVSYVTGSRVVGLTGTLKVADSGLKISALRSATALQKYKEIQNSNDPDFANQVLLILEDRKSTRLNSSHITRSRMPSSA